MRFETFVDEGNQRNTSWEKMALRSCMSKVLGCTRNTLWMLKARSTERKMVNVCFARVVWGIG